jgi:hypothetical protein
VWAAAGRNAALQRMAALVSLAVFASVAAGFWYWGLPYAYGYKVTPAEHAARMWSKKW